MKKYRYPSKNYLVGFFLALLVITYGGVVIYQITIIEGNSSLFALAYILLSIYIMLWYKKNFFKYKDQYFVIEDNCIKLINKLKTEVIKKEDIDCIIAASHLQFLKVHNVIHIYTDNGDYYFFTNEMVNYNSFKAELQKTFPFQFVSREKLVMGYPTITKEFLLYNRYR